MSNSSAASSATLASITGMTDSNSDVVPSWMLRNTGMTPIPSGISRMNSSSEPGRMVGLMIPTVPRQLVNANAPSPAAVSLATIQTRSPQTDPKIMSAHDEKQAI